MKQIPWLLNKDKPLSISDMSNIRKNDVMKKGSELCILFAKPDCGKSNFTEQTLREFLKDKQ